MGFGKHILEDCLGAEIQERYGVSFKVYVNRGYHLYEYEDDIRRDIAARGTG